MSVDYVIRALQPRDETAVLALLEDTLSGGPTGQRTHAFFKWKHEMNPFGPSPSIVAESDGDLLGLRIFMRWEFGAGTSTVRAVRAVDTATVAARRGQGIFRELTRSALEAVSDSADFVFNTPNVYSLPANLRMGWDTVGRVPVHVRPLHPLRFLRGARQSRQLATTTTDRTRCPLPDARTVIEGLPGLGDLLGEVMAAQERTGALHTRRTLDYLRWRYADAPDLDYRAAGIVKSGETRGLAIGRPRRRGALQEFTLSELIVRPGDTGTARDLLTAVRTCGCDHIAAHFAAGSPGLPAARRSGFMRVPGGVTLVTNVIGSPAVDPRRLSNWHLSIGDIEVF